MHSRSEGPAFFCLWEFASVEEIPGFFYSTLPSQIWKVIFLFIKWEQIYVKLANFHLFQCVFRRKNADPQSVLANSINAIFFRIFSETSQKLSIQSIRRPKWHFISSRCLSSAIPERQYQIFVNYHKPSIHCFISFEALITWPIYLDVILWRSFYCVPKWQSFYGWSPFSCTQAFDVHDKAVNIIMHSDISCF